MNAIDVLFRTGQFNLSQVRKHFINPCCFGEDLAAWLRIKLLEKGVEPAEPYQEDWGWELPAKYAGDSYYLCVSGNQDDPYTDRDEGEWRIIVEKRRTLWRRITGDGKISPDDPLLRIVETILSGESTIRNVRRS